MFIQLPKPYHDELLYSVIARFLVHYRVPRVGYAIRQLFGKQTAAKTGLPSSLANISKCTWDTWQMTATDILMTQTLFPYYVCYFPRDRIERCARDFIEGGGLGAFNRLGITASSVVPPRYLRFCPTCAASDIAKFGETYWRRCHQLPGVLVCVEHRIPLWNSTALSTPTSMYDYVDATCSYLTSPKDGGAIDVPLHKMDLAIQVTIRCQELLTKTSYSERQGSLPKIYVEQLRERNFYNHMRLRSLAELEERFIDFYTKPFLQSLGVEIPSGMHNGWLSRILRQREESLHPLLHTIFQIFLEGIPAHGDKSTSPPFGKGPWRCVNPYARHKGARPIKNLHVRLIRGSWVATAKCECGCEFSFRGISKNDSSTPIDYKIYQYGPLWTNEAKRLKTAGYTIQAISVEMEISPIVAKKLLSRPQKLKRKSSVTRATISKWKRIFLAFKNLPTKERTLAHRKAYRNAYALLRHYDKQWLNQELSKKGKADKLSSIDWDKRDELWAPIIRQTASLAYDEIPLKQVTARKITMLAGLPKGLKDLYRLPKVSQVIEECCETLDDFRARRLQFAAKQILDRGLPMKRWRLYTFASLRKPGALSPRLKDLADKIIFDNTL